MFGNKVGDRRDLNCASVLEGGTGKGQGIAINTSVSNVRYMVVSTGSNPRDGSCLTGMSLRFFSICEGKNIRQGVRFLDDKGCLYDVLLFQNEEGDTPLHVAIKNNNADLTREIFRILKEPHNSSYECKYFKDKEKDEKPLSKVINTCNKKGRDVLALAIEGSNKECISTVFKYLAHDEKMIQSLIECCNDKIDSLRKKLVDNDKKSALTRCFLNKGQLYFSLLACLSSLITASKIVYDQVAARTSPRNIIIEYTSSPSTIDTAFGLISSTPGLMIFFNYVVSKMLSSYEKKDSSLQEEIHYYTEERGKLENELSHFQERESHRAEVNSIRTRLLTMSSELKSYREESQSRLSFCQSCHGKENPVSANLSGVSSDNVFNSLRNKN